MGLPRRAQAGVAVGLALAFVTLAGSTALADQNRNAEWWLQAIHVTNAWLSSRGAGVTVAVLDTGVDPNQADLVGSVTTGPDFSQSGRGASGQFWGIHGTEMASLIAGHGHGPGGTDGIIGIAPAAKILSVRVTLESNDPQLANATVAARLPGGIAHGIRYAVNNGASVIDLPLDPVTTPGAAGAGGSTAEREAVAYALAHHVILVAPAGDDGAGNDAVNYPAAYPGVIAVGAFNANFVKAPFSSRQPHVTVTAPGQGVTAAKRQGYAQVNSTSAASAIVVGIVAQIRALFPHLTPAQVTRALAASTVFRPPKARSNGSGYGTVDAQRALIAASGMVEAVPTTAASPGAGVIAGQAAPSPPAVHAPASSLSRMLIADAAIAVGVFLVLFAAILAFKATQRRRARLARLAEVRAAAQVQARRLPESASPAGGQASAVGAPPASGFRGTPLAGSSFPGTLPSRTVPGSPAAPAAGPLPGLGEPGAAIPESAFSIDFARPTGEPPGGSRPSLSGSGFPGTGSTRPGGSHRTAPARPVKVSGSPPWEPAPRPAGELPWGQAQALAPLGGSPAPPDESSPRPAQASWDAIAEDAWPGGPRTAAPHAPAPAPSNLSARSAAGGGMVPSMGGGNRPPPEQPIYVWNPGGSATSSAGRPGGVMPTQASPPWEIGEPAARDASTDPPDAADFAGGGKPIPAGDPGTAGGWLPAASRDLGGTPLASPTSTGPTSADSTSASSGDAGLTATGLTRTDLTGTGSGFRGLTADGAFSIPAGGEPLPGGSFGGTSLGGGADSFSIPAGDAGEPFYHPPGAGAGFLPAGHAGDSTDSFTAIPAGDHGPNSPLASESTETFPTVPPDEAGRDSQPDR